MEESFIDESGVVFSADKTILIKAPEGLREYEIPEGTKVIKSNAFKDCWQTLGMILIPESVVSIDEFAFTNCRMEVSVTTPAPTTEERLGVFAHLLKVHGAENPEEKAAAVLGSTNKGRPEPKREMETKLWLARDESDMFPWELYQQIVKDLGTDGIKRDRLGWSIGRWAEENFVGTTKKGEPWNGVVFYASMDEPHPRRSGTIWEGRRD